jgi:NAD(P)-dependent dehydrogenase (short-subunit alcohol dehydrogenase family)
MRLLEERTNLQGKVAAVIGGAFGISAAITTSLAAAGVVAFCDIKKDALEPTREAVEKFCLDRLRFAVDPVSEIFHFGKP